MTYGGKTDAQRAYEETLARRLMDACYARGWTYRDLARASGIHENSVYLYATGKSTPQPYYLAKMCVALKLDANRLLGIRRP